MYKISFDINPAVFVKNPEHSELGQKIVKSSIDAIAALGFEQFTFKKLAIEIGTTEATIYRYFENKHRLLLYIINWYWLYIDYLIDNKVNLITDKKLRLIAILEILTNEQVDNNDGLHYDKKKLHAIILEESAKVYLMKEVDAINEQHAFLPYKNLCSKIASHISAFSPSYNYPKSLSTTIIESSHQQQFFSQHLPRLTDNEIKTKNFTFNFLSDLLFKVL